VSAVSAPPLRLRLKQALPTAMKARDKVAVDVLRATLAAIDNAEAVSATSVPSAGAVEASPIGVGVTEVARRELTDADVTTILRAEIADREAAVSEYERIGAGDRAERLRTEAALLAGYLD